VLATDGARWWAQNAHRASRRCRSPNPNQDGEIQVAANMLFSATSTSRSTRIALTGDGWSAHRRSRAHGRARSAQPVTGRLKDVIIRKGENISAQEVEDGLVEHPDVRDVAVIGCPTTNGANAAARSSWPSIPAKPPTLACVVDYCIAARTDAPEDPRATRGCRRAPLNSTARYSKPTLRKRYN
jgi:acyl-CoA synthetase (AMP-forming)/AMP-acid ligase II